jgi:hypothetical protein
LKAVFLLLAGCYQEGARGQDSHREDDVSPAPETEKRNLRPSGDQRTKKGMPATVASLRTSVKQPNSQKLPPVVVGRRTSENPPARRLLPGGRVGQAPLKSADPRATY